MDGFKTHYLQGASFNRSNNTGRDGFVHRNSFPRIDANNIHLDLGAIDLNLLKGTQEDGYFTTLAGPSVFADADFSCGVVAKGRFVYVMPRSGTSIIKFNIDDDSTSVIGSFSVTANKWVSASLGADGYTIYAMPYQDTRILKLDTRYDTISYIQVDTIPGVGWGGIVLHSNGCLYAVPIGSSYLLKINTVNGADTLEMIKMPVDDSGPGVAYKQFIYYFPLFSSTCLKFNTLDNTWTSFGFITPNVNGGFNGACLAPNGMIYASPYSFDVCGKIDPTTDTFSTFGSVSSDPAKWVGLKLAANGCLYSVPISSNGFSVFKIDPSNDTHSTYATSISSIYSSELCLAEDGCLYSAPFTGVLNQYMLRILSKLPNQIALDKRFYNNRNL